MRTSRLVPVSFAFILLLGVLLGGCGFAVFGPRIAPSSALLHDQLDEFYPVGDTKRVKYSYPNRPFDTDITIEGIGWDKGKLYVVIQSQVNAQQVYTYISKKLSPTITYRGKTFLLDKVLWEEGTCETYQNSICRYAVTSEETAMIPAGTLPDSLQVMEQHFSLPSQAPAPVALNAKHQLTAQVDHISGMIESDGLTYQVTGVQIDDQTRRVSMLVTSETGAVETSRFLLTDDKGRIYTFDSSTIPREYESGENEFSLTIAQPLPEDVVSLELVLFETEIQQLALHNIVSEARIELFFKKTRSPF
ncbi:hypothetical protein [Brevibacillus sp. H7]|uniref:hypothetical protein n=1 Tax=Brevibacillus sp. H7 TaxID=3349138 RepID=UPI00382A14D2